MSHDARKYPHDVNIAAEKIQAFTRGRTFSEYQDDDLLKSAFERRFEIIREALNQLSRRQPEICQRITGYRRAIAFRNILIHGYAEVDDEVVWRVLTDNLPALHADVMSMLDG